MINKNRIGLLAGTFDPVHTGHLDFIDRTIRQSALDKVYLLIEKTPKHKPIFSDFTDRKAMLELAIKNYPRIGIYNCEAPSYPISHCLPKIKQAHSATKIYLLVGHDVAEHIGSWDAAGNLLEEIELVVADRNDGITSGKIRNALAKNQMPAGLSPEVLAYIRQKNLYGSETISGE